VYHLVFLEVGLVLSVEKKTRDKMSFIDYNQIDLIDIVLSNFSVAKMYASSAL